jgi:hypothetical protein
MTTPSNRPDTGVRLGSASPHLRNERSSAGRVSQCGAAGPQIDLQRLQRMYNGGGDRQVSERLDMGRTRSSAFFYMGYAIKR